MEIVTSVSRVRGGVRLIIGSESITVPAALYRARPLQEGDEVDLDEYDRWLLLRQYRPALDCAVRLLSQRAWAAGELGARLERLGYRPQTVEMVLYKLSSNQLLDDTSFARQWAAARANRKLGASRIAMELRRKGVSEEDTALAIQSLDEETQSANAASLAQKAVSRAKPGEDPRKTAQRAIAMLARRGFSYELARSAVRQAMCGEDELT